MKQKTLIISGGSSGIGESIVTRFLANDYQVYNLDIKANSSSQSLDNDAGHSAAHFVQCDITDHQKVAECVQAIAEVADINTVISNAGVHYSATIENTTEQAFMRVFDINVKGAYSLTQAALPFMKKQGGSIIYIASDQSVIGKTNSFAYNISKHSLASMAKTTALDYAAFNIRANAICPGTIETPLYHQAINHYCETSGADAQTVHDEEASMQPLGRIGQPDEVASLAFYLASDDASFITGSLQMIDGGYTAR